MGRKDVFCADLRGTFWDQVTLEKYAAFQHNCIETVVVHRGSLTTFCNFILPHN